MSTGGWLRLSGSKVAPSTGPSNRQPASDNLSDYGATLYCKNFQTREPGRSGVKNLDYSLPLSGDANQEEGMRRLKDVGDKQTLITAAELGLIQQYRELKLAGQDILAVDIYHYSSILYACYGNQYKILQLVEREFCSGSEELTRFHTTRCWIGKNSAMVAAYQGHLETILYIVDLDLQGKFGEVDLFKQRDIMGKTAMDWAASQGHTDTLEVLLVRSLYQLLPPHCTDPLVVRTRRKLVALLAELARHCRDYDPASDRRFFQEVLTSIKCNPTPATAATADVGPGAAGDFTASTGGGGGCSGPHSRASLIKTAACIGDEIWDGLDEQQDFECVNVLQPSGCRGGIASGVGGSVGGGEVDGGGCDGSGGSGRKESAKWATRDGGSGRSGGANGSGGGGGGDGGGVGGGGGGDGSDSGGSPKDLHISAAMLMDVVTSAHKAGTNCMGVIMYIQALVQQARYFDDLVSRCTAWEVGLLDTCRNKSEVQAVLTPTHDDPSEPVGYALATRDKAFLSHKYIQQVFTEKWDTMGVTDYASSALSLVWASLVLVVAFAGWVVLCPVVIVLRAFLSPVEDFLQRGKVIVDSRFPWHVPLYRWLLAQCSLLAFVVLLSYQVFSSSFEPTLSAALSPINTLLAVWCVAILVEELQEYLEEGRSAYMASGWNLMDVTTSTAFLLHYFLRIGVVATDGARNVGALLVVNDLLAAAALMAWFRVVSVFELSSSIGPLIQMMKQMLLQDVTRFALLVVVILLGFTVGMEALFKDVCLEIGVDDECVRYSSWAYDWRKHGLLGGMTYLQYVALGNMQVTDFEQKRVTGLVFYLIFAVITSILMLNLFIAMLADTYARVSNKAKVEFRYRKAVIMASFSRREAICPPFNLLHLVVGAAGNMLRRTVFGAGGFSAVRLHKNEDTALFPWYFPHGDELAAVVELQQRVVGEFLRSVRVGLVKDRLQADLPVLMRHLVQHRNQQQQQRGGAAGYYGDGDGGEGRKDDTGRQDVFGMAAALGNNKRTDTVARDVD